MVTILPIVVVNEANHVVEFDLSPVDPTGNVYRMQIRQDPASNGTPEASFTPTISGNVVQMTGDCSNLLTTTTYYYDLEEDGSTICSGPVQVIQKVTK